MLRERLRDAPPPHEAHARLAARSGTTFILESRDGPERLARYSFVGWDPVGTVACTPNGLQVTGALPAPSVDQDPLEYLRRVQRFYHADDHQTPFVGGLVGSIGYDFARTLEPTLDQAAPCPAAPVEDTERKAPNRSAPIQGVPEAWPRFLFGLYLDALVYDHRDDSTWYVSRGEDRRAALMDALHGPVPQDPGLRIGALHATMDRTRFTAAVQDAQDLIRAGEVFQIVLSRAFQGACSGGLVPLYTRLRRDAAVPYLYHLRFGCDPRDATAGCELVGASPEMLVRVRQGRVETFPIAGTRPVTGDPATDQAAGEDLRRDPKETAEHAMLVDLARNDVGRIAAFGTVQVEAYQDLHAFHTVQHLVSHVTGNLSPDRDALDALAAVFPAGTVSGAPRLRAMEHIARLEPTPRGPYAGAVAYVSCNGDLDSAITIRSASRTGGILTVQAGAGIVLHSDPDAECDETRHKAGTMLQALRPFQEAPA